MKNSGFFKRFSGKCGQFKKRWFIKRATKKLMLDDSQQNKLSVLIEKFQSDKNDLEQTGRKSRSEVLSSLLHNDGEEVGMNREQVKSMLKSGFVTMQQTVNNMIDDVADFVESLDSHQRTQLLQYVSNCHSHRSCHRCHH